MKKFTKLVTLLLVLVMMVSMLAIPAAATGVPEDDCRDAATRAPVGPLCPDCHVLAEYAGEYNDMYKFVCPSCSRVFWKSV